MIVIDIQCKSWTIQVQDLYTVILQYITYIYSRFYLDPIKPISEISDCLLARNETYLSMIPDSSQTPGKIW